MPKRLLSIDVFRAVTMLLMIFVNDVGGVHHIPEWIDHAAANEDRLGFADTIFPAFLFIVGLSLPLALQQREKKGYTTVALLWYIIGRSAALIIMGFFHVNGESYSHEAVLPHSVWTMLTTFSFFLIWLYYPSSLSATTKNILRSLGVTTLVVMAFLYKGGDEEGELHGMQTSWWGILGIIGWAYFACSILYVLLYGKLNRIFISFLLLLTINILSHTGLLHFHIGIIDDASSATLVMGGVATTLLYSQLADTGKWKKGTAIISGAGIACIVVGCIVRPFSGGISKIYATPAWVLICMGISLLVYVGFVWLIDVKDKYSWFKLIKPAGTSTLTCYLLPYLFYSSLALLHVWYPDVLNEGLLGILRSFVLAFSIIAIAGLLERKSIRLKL